MDRVITFESFVRKDCGSRSMSTRVCQLVTNIFDFLTAHCSTTTALRPTLGEREAAAGKEPPVESRPLGLAVVGGALGA